MDGLDLKMDWDRWQGKKVFIRTKLNRTYSGIVKEIADIGDNIIFISILDKFGMWATFTISEIVEIKEEK